MGFILQVLGRLSVHIVLLLPLVCVAIDTAVPQLQITHSSTVEISGSYRGYHFSARRDPKQPLVQVAIDLGERQVNATVGRGVERDHLDVSIIERSNDSRVGLTAADRQLIQQMLKLMAYTPELVRYDHGRVILNLLNMLAASPPGALHVNAIPAHAAQDLSMGEGRCRFPPERNGISDICSLYGRQQTGYYPGEGTLCNTYIDENQVSHDLNRPADPWENAELVVVGGDSCMGRCGNGCIGADWPNNKINIYTQDCLNYDLCVRERGEDDPECNWMFVLTIDDFKEGSNCPGAAHLVPTILANGSTSDITVRYGEHVVLTTRLDPGNFIEKEVELWIYAETPIGLFHYSFVEERWKPGMHRSGVTLLSEALPEILLDQPLAEGNSHVVFAIDENSDGIRDQTWSDSITITVLNPLALNDTGIVGCADAGSSGRPCPAAGFPGQDAEYGTSAGGDPGFDFTKLDGDGNELPPDAQEWQCVRDNTTKLLWEVKSRDGRLHDRHNTYSWYDTRGTPSEENPGTSDGGDCQGSRCDTEGYVDAVNGIGLCGWHDWRMPTVNELESITHLGRFAPAISTAYFPNTNATYIWSAYWSGDSQIGEPDKAWYVSFYTGHTYFYHKRYGEYVRLVRDTGAD